MAMRSALSRGLVIRSMESTNRGAFTRFFSDKGRVLSEEEQAKENVYIQKWEREKLEKQKQQADKVKAEKEKDVADKVGILTLEKRRFIYLRIFCVNNRELWSIAVSITT
ncbi:ATPase inhibitor [Sesbania bispinosa]|nr:ATPase inhibitor [Sesbania bispinosa]